MLTVSLNSKDIFKLKILKNRHKKIGNLTKYLGLLLLKLFNGVASFADLLLIRHPEKWEIVKLQISANNNWLQSARIV